MSESTDILDQALEVVSGAAPDFANGNSNHAPMVAETLSFLGRDEAIMPWIEDYRADLRDRPAGQPALDGDWQEALGKMDLWPAWVALFRRELADGDWHEVLDLWVGRLAPGLSGEAGHGIIRTAHAVRALTSRHSEPRLNELADALAYWAATYHDFKMALPTSYRFGLKKALAHVAPIEVSQAGNIDQTLARLDTIQQFAPVLNLFQPGPDPLADLSALTEHFAGIYLANAHDRKRVFPLIHAFTGPSALRLLAPNLSKPNLSLALQYTWQTAAAIYAVWSRDPVAPDSVADAGESAKETAPDHLAEGANRSDAAGENPGTSSLADAAVSGGAAQASDAAGESAGTSGLVDAAVWSGAAHSIKFTEACLREYALNPKPIYLAAAADAIGRLEG